MKMSFQNTPNKKLLFNLYRRIIFSRQFLSTKVQEENVPSETIVAEDTPIFEDRTDEAREKKIEEMRNTSRLHFHHRSMVLGQLSGQIEETSPRHATVKWQKRILGRYGMQALDVPFGVIWPTKAEIEDTKEYERVAYPMTLQESWAEFEKRNKAEADAIIARDQEVAANMAKMQQWKDQLMAKIAKKEAELQAAKERKERMVEEVRRHFGFKIDPKDERFKTLLAEKEKEDKKKKKEEKKKIRAARVTAHLMDLQKQYTNAVESNSDIVDNEKKKEFTEQKKDRS